MKENEGYRFRLQWQCYVCGREYTSIYEVKDMKDISAPRTLSCPDCEAEHPRYKGFDRID